VVPGGHLVEVVEWSARAGTWGLTNV